MKKFRLIILMLVMSDPLMAQNNLDLIGLPSTNAQTAYGLRQLSSGYSGAAVRVRRTSDNLEVAVGFDNSASKMVSASSPVTVMSGVTINTTGYPSGAGTISTLQAKSGTLTVVVNKTGTISTTLGQVIVSGTSTSFTTQINSGDILYTSGNVLLGVVKSVTSNTALVLNNGCMATATNSNFRTQWAEVTGSGTDFTNATDGFQTGDRLYSSAHAYLGTVISVASSTSMFLNSRDATAYSGSFEGTTATVTGSGTSFSSGDIGKFLISANGITLGVISAVTDASTATLSTKAGDAVSASGYRIGETPADFGAYFTGTDVFVRTWYDQSGYGRDLIQQSTTANQPGMVSGGTLYMVNDKPSIQFASSMSSFLRTLTPATWLTGTLYTLNCVSAEASAAIPASYSFLMSTTGYGGPANTISHYGYRTSNQYTVAQYNFDVNFYTQASTSLETHTGVKSSMVTTFFYKNGVSLGSLGNAGATHLADLGLFNIGFYTPISNSWYNGAISEITIFAKALTDTERQNLDNNQNTYFNVQTSYWTGAANTTDWNTPGNWSPAVVPTSSEPNMVVIPAGCSYYPNITSTGSAMNLSVNSGGSVIVSTGGKLQIAGRVNSFGTFNATAGAVELNGTNAQFAGFSGPVNQLIINNSAGVTMSNSFTVSGNLTFTSGWLSLGGLSLTLGGTVTNTVSGGLRGSVNANITVTGSPELSFNQSGTNNNLRNLTVNGSGAVASLASNLIMAGGGTLTFTNGKLAVGSNSLYIRGNVTNTASGGLRGNGSSNIIVDGVLNPTLSLDQTTPGTTNAFNNITIATTASNTVAVAGDFSMNGTLAVNSNQTLNLGSAAMSGASATVSNSGTINTQNTTALPLPSGKTWGGLVQYNHASNAQTVVPGIYNHLTIATTGGATAAGDITVNGILTLAGNPNETNGSLEMTKNYGDYSNILTPVEELTTRGTKACDILDSYILTMGASSSCSGTGDVTGRVQRTTIAANTEYFFGSPYSSITFTSEGTLPTAVTFVITKGSDRGIHANLTTTVARLYQVIQTGGSGSKFTMKLRYLESELNGNSDEDNLVLWDHHIKYTSANTPHEHGKTGISTAENWVSIAGHGINYLASEELIDGFTKYWMIKSSASTDGSRWLGAAPDQQTEWNVPSNWTGGSVPSASTKVIIQAAAYYPTLPGDAEAGSVTIEPGATLNGGTGTLTIKRGPLSNGGAGSWSNLGTFNPGTSTVVFNYSGGTYSGNTDFYNITILNDTSNLTMQSGSHMKIAGTVTNNGTWEAAVFDNTVEYNGGAQTVVKPNGTGGYHHLTLSGSGLKTLPSASLSVAGDLVMEGTASATASGALTIGNDFNIGVNTSFTAENFGHSLGGDFINNGSFSGTGSDITMNGTGIQTLSGSSATTFEDLTIDNASGVTLNSSGLTTVTGVLQINSGKKIDLAAGRQLTVTGTITNNGGPEGFTIRSSATGTGSLLYNGTVSGTVERYIANDLKWHFLSSPVGAQPIWPAFSPTPEELSGIYYFNQTPYNWDFYYWNPNARTTDQLYWVNLRKNAEGEYNERDVDAPGNEAGFGATIPPVFIAGRGYLTAYGDDWNPATGSPTVHSFTGTVNGGGISWAVTKGANSYNLLGNPYPSAIDWKATGGWSNRPNLVQNNDGYDYWVYSDDAGNYGLFNSAGSSGTNGATRYIAPMQAVFVNAASTGSIGMDYNVQVHAEQAWLKSEISEMNILRFRLSTTANHWYDEVNLEVDTALVSGGSKKFRSMYSEAPELYSIRDGSFFSIERRPEVNDQTELILGVKAGVASTYSFEAKGLTTFSYAKSILLEDLSNGNVQELKSSPVYFFSAGPDDPPARLRIRFTGPYDVPQNHLVPVAMVWYADQTIFIRGNNHENLNGKVTLFNLTGQMVFNRQVCGNDIRLSVDLPSGCYITCFISDTGVIVRKIMVH